MQPADEALKEQEKQTLGEKLAAAYKENEETASRHAASSASTILSHW